MIDDFRAPVRRKPVITPPVPGQPVINTESVLPQPETVAPPAETVEVAVEPAIEEVAPATVQVAETEASPEEDSVDSELVALENEEPAPDMSEEHSGDVTADEVSQLAPDPPKPKQSFWSKLKPTTKKQKILAGVLAVLVAFGVGAGWTAFHPTPPAKAVVVKPKAKAAVKPAPEPIVSKLTGLPITDKAINDRPVTGVMIENSPDARPQSGLDQAGVVFEAIAEGGITRFLTLYQDSEPDYLGPVRSVRPYYLQWCLGFDCPIAHVGGSAEALEDIGVWGMRDLDQFYNSAPYYRLSTRYAPHNVYTSLAALRELETKKGFTTSTYTGFSRKKENPYKAQPATPAPTAGSSTQASANKTTTSTPADTRTVANGIDLAISGYYYNSHFDYDPATNSYKRSQAGAPHTVQHKDGSLVQLQPKVVIAMIMQYAVQADGKHSDYNAVGSGAVLVFQDGVVTTGTWSKPDMKSQITFLGADNKPIDLNPGQTWITAMSDANKVTYK